MKKLIKSSMPISLLSAPTVTFAHHEAVVNFYDFNNLLLGMIFLTTLGASIIGLAFFANLKKIKPKASKEI